MSIAYVVSDEDGNTYGPYASVDEAADLCDAMFEDRIMCEIKRVELPFQLQQDRE
jgi:hypothetical protein